MNQSKICLMEGLKRHWRLLVSVSFILLIGGWCFQRYFLRAKHGLLNHVEEKQAASKGIETIGLMQENPLVRVERMKALPSNTLHRPDPLEIMIPIVIRLEKGGKGGQQFEMTLLATPKADEVLIKQDEKTITRLESVSHRTVVLGTGQYIVKFQRTEDGKKYKAVRKISLSSDCKVSVTWKDEDWRKPIQSSSD